MNTAQRMGLARAGGDVASGTERRAHVSLEVLLVVVVVAGQLLALLTHVLLGDALTLVVAAAVILRRMRAEVRALQA